MITGKVNQKKMYTMATLIPAAFLVLVVLIYLMKKYIQKADATNPELELESQRKANKDQDECTVAEPTDDSENQIAEAMAETVFLDKHRFDNPHLQMDPTLLTAQDQAIYKNHRDFAQHINNVIDIV
jgi:hypothetical protein